MKIMKKYLLLKVNLVNTYLKVKFMHVILAF